MTSIAELPDGAIELLVAGEVVGAIAESVPHPVKAKVAIRAQIESPTFTPKKFRDFTGRFIVISA